MLTNSLGSPVIGLMMETGETIVNIVLSPIAKTKEVVITGQMRRDIYS